MMRKLELRTLEVWIKGRFAKSCDKSISKRLTEKQVDPTAFTAFRGSYPHLKMEQDKSSRNSPLLGYSSRDNGLFVGPFVPK
jgi:hypothetical protein